MGSPEPAFLDLGGGLHGAMVAGPDGALLLTVFHEPTGRALYGTELDLASAEGWFEGARLIFAEAEGRA